MRRRVEIARGLVHEPKIFFSTNRRPAGPRVARARVEMLQRIKAERDLTVLVTTHYMDGPPGCTIRSRSSTTVS
jgi:ABC-2 type transport system ATP-binding protein